MSSPQKHRSQAYKMVNIAASKFSVVKDDFHNNLELQEHVL